MCDGLGIDDDIDDSDEDRFDPIYLKYCFEGATSLRQLAFALRALADDLDRRVAEGWRLSEPVDGGWAHLELP